MTKSRLFDDLPERVSVSQAYQAIGCTERTLRRWIADGILPAHRVGPRRIIIKRADLEKLVKAAS